MRKELQDKLFEKYPLIFAEKDLDMSVTCMCWGIDTGDGWYDLLDNLCGSLQWWTDENGHPQVVATQVKEKFGGLRFYFRDCSDFQDGMISFAQHMSSTICEKCGNPGKRENRNGWISVMCPECEKKLT